MNRRKLLAGAASVAALPLIPLAGVLAPVPAMTWDECETLYQAHCFRENVREAMKTRYSMEWHRDLDLIPPGHFGDAFFDELLRLGRP